MFCGYDGTDKSDEVFADNYDRRYDGRFNLLNGGKFREEAGGIDRTYQQAQRFRDFVKEEFEEVNRELKKFEKSRARSFVNPEFMDDRFTRFIKVQEEQANAKPEDKKKFQDNDNIWVKYRLENCKAITGITIVPAKGRDGTHKKLPLKLSITGGN